MTKRVILTVMAAALALAGCSNAKEQLGLTREAPDEFAVVKRAPLEMPPDYTLRPPRPGVSRPQERDPSLQAEDALFGEAVMPSDGHSAGEQALLQQTGAPQAEPGIRDIVDQETAALPPKKEPVAKRLLGLGKDQPPAADVVDPAAELERLKQNQAEGKPVTAGDTPILDE